MDSLPGVLNEILILHPAGLKEYALVQILKHQGVEPFVRCDLGDELSLFRTHFFLFHHLYRLQAQLRLAQTGDLQIHCLSIVLRPWQEGVSLALHDPLAGYYLDVSRLESTTRAEVKVMLEWFWRRLTLEEGRGGAYAVLGLSAGASVVEIKRRYRELAMQHHPDHGGQAARFREIAEAVDLLLNF